MITESYFQTMDDGIEVSVNRWIPDDREIKGIIQLSHGMVEHSLRYDRLGSILAENGYIFCAHDHRGHGRTAQRAEQTGKGSFGILAEKDGFNRVVKDLDAVLLKTKADYPGLKSILLGHSFGSFVAQAFIEKYSCDISACVLCGTAGPQNVTVHFGKFIADFVHFFHGSVYRSAILKKAAFGKYTKHIPDAMNGEEWLSRDKEAVQMYLNDAWCGFNPSVGFYRDMLNGLLQIHNSKNMKKIPADLPVLVMCGSEDPVGNYGKTVENLVYIYKTNGMKNVELKMYDGARHELFNETNKDQVIADMTAWIEENV